MGTKKTTDAHQRQRGCLAAVHLGETYLGTKNKPRFVPPGSVRCLSSWNLDRFFSASRSVSDEVISVDSRFSGVGSPLYFFTTWRCGAWISPVAISRIVMVKRVRPSTPSGMTQT